MKPPELLSSLWSLPITPWYEIIVSCNEPLEMAGSTIIDPKSTPHIGFFLWVRPLECREGGKQDIFSMFCFSNCTSVSEGCSCLSFVLVFFLPLMMHEHTTGKHEERKSKPHIGLVCVRAEKIINYVKNVSRSHTDSLLLCQLYHLIGEIRRWKEKSAL